VIIQSLDEVELKSKSRNQIFLSEVELSDFFVCYVFKLDVELHQELCLGFGKTNHLCLY
jgi:hypothetical protein